MTNKKVTQIKKIIRFNPDLRITKEFQAMVTIERRQMSLFYVIIKSDVNCVF
ncbi:hypothetical protein [Wukongibacter baidiensis]